jgi:hypothetical protein
MEICADFQGCLDLKPAEIASAGCAMGKIPHRAFVEG